jgi:hypothetical protein
LRQKAREQPANQPMLEVDLHDFRRVAAVGQARRSRLRSAKPTAPTLFVR